ncbi:ParB N-terminal domain-containing protein [Crossiella sp. CA-258035]|nr:ParB N-terminal domain-containing protein [Crossiella sp. CA-258035]WHT23686.1 ParB N-terminal domain-containing protein [Crossiella sp. CA-258035]
METVAIGSLLPADSPRLDGEVGEHAHVLAETGATLPPIIVHRPTMRVIDGMHRLQAARLRGERRIRVRFYDGDAENAFILAVHANIAHGMPLSLADRTAAAERILVSRPQWSDRMIAAATGLAPRTVGAVRRRSSAQAGWSNTRLGRDGRVRPVSSAAGRRLAGTLLADNPSASLREIAKAAGLAPSTVRDVRRRLHSGLDPVPGGQREPPSADQPPTPSDQGADLRAALRTLQRDPALRFTESGRKLLRWLDTHLIEPDDWPPLVDCVPAHCTGMVVALARTNAAAWQDFAERLDGRRRTTA